MEALTYLLVKAGEETNEIGQAIGKVAAYGPFDCDPRKEVLEYNLEHMVKEVNDLHGVLIMVHRRMVLAAMANNDTALRERIDKIFGRMGNKDDLMAKQRRLIEWATHSVKTGQLPKDEFRLLCYDMEMTLPEESEE
jgi:hypothetical protein